MLYVDAMDDHLRFFPCEEVTNGDGTIACRLPDGKFLSLNPVTGEWDPPVENVGPWESFKRAGDAIVLDLEWGGQRYALVRPVVEA
jgi:hypothetical protein